MTTKLERNDDEAVLLLAKDFEQRLCKDKVRFAVGGPEARYSSVWVARRTKSDFYIGIRSVMGRSSKISLHGETRICKLGLTNRHFSSAVQRGLFPPARR
jgi:hypothetical protein